MTVRNAERIEVAARAIWDIYAGDCNSDCRWTDDPACLCKTICIGYAEAALTALDKLSGETADKAKE